MKRVFKKNQIVLTLLAVMIAIAGYLNYIGKEADSQNGIAAGLTDISEEDILAENQAASAAMENASGSEDASKVGEAVFTSGTSVTEFITEVNLDKEQTRAKNKETLLSIVNSDAVSEEQKKEAIDTMVQMTGIAEMENAAETVLKTKGFENAVVSITDGTVDVVLGQTEITDAQRAQIEDVVTRKTEIGVENMTISLMNAPSSAEASSGNLSEEVSGTAEAAGSEENAGGSPSGQTEESPESKDGANPEEKSESKR